MLCTLDELKNIKATTQLQSKIYEEKLYFTNKYSNVKSMNDNCFKVNMN